MPYQIFVEYIVFYVAMIYSQLSLSTAGPES